MGAWKLHQPKTKKNTIQCQSDAKKKVKLEMTFAIENVCAKNSKSFLIQTTLITISEFVLDEKYQKNASKFVILTFGIQKPT